MASIFEGLEHGIIDRRSYYISDMRDIEVVLDELCRLGRTEGLFLRNTASYQLTNSVYGNLTQLPFWGAYDIRVG